MLDAQILIGDSSDLSLPTGQQLNKLDELIPHQVAKQLVIFPINVTENTLTIWHPDPLNILIADQVRQIIGPQYQVNIIAKNEEYIRKKIDEFYLIKTRQNQPINDIIERAILLNASDIHLAPSEDYLELLFRIDGQLIVQEQLPTQEAQRLVAILKLKARLNVAESRKPQSGSFTQVVFNKKIDFRISTHPTIYGETLNVRILNCQTALLSLRQLGFDADTEHSLSEMLKLKQGMIILTGPTGSGKTTTLYAMLNILSKSNLNIMTIEDPVEYKLPGIRQSEINPHKDLDYASGIKSILRQDPDVILIGEIRDEETAKMAFRAAITGHLVLTTLHTKDSIGAIERLQDLGVASSYIANALTVVVAQRLVRQLCQSCKAGCDACNKTGFNGRTTICEVLIMNDALRQLILHKADCRQIKSAHDIIISLLADSATVKLQQGIVSYEEVRQYLGQQ